MSTYLDQYKRLDKKLTWVRWAHGGLRSDEEEATLEEMDQVWRKLDESEREMLSGLSVNGDAAPPIDSQPIMIDEVVQLKDSKPVRRLRDAA